MRRPRTGAGGRGCGGLAVEGLPVVEAVGGRGGEGGAWQEWDDGVAKELGGMDAELLLKRVHDGLLVALFAEQEVESGDRLCATAAAALGAATGITANTGLKHGCISFEGFSLCLLQKVRYQHLCTGKGEAQTRYALV